MAKTTGAKGARTFRVPANHPHAKAIAVLAKSGQNPVAAEKPNELGQEESANFQKYYPKRRRGSDMAGR